jgi:transposase
MIRPETEKWSQTLADLRRLSVEAAHPRTRERFLALYIIGSQQRNATQWAIEIGRDDNTVMGWVHTYNASGPEALYYRRTGGRPPLLPKNRLPRSQQPYKRANR